MKGILLALLLLIIGFGTSAQTNGKTSTKTSTGTITGKMVDMESEPLGYGELVLYKESDSSFVNGTSSNIDGDFVLEDIQPGRYYATLSYIGYRKKTFSELEFKANKNKDVDLGTVQLRLGSVELAEIIVSGEKNVMEVKMDRRIFNADKSLVSKGGNGLDLLRDIPSVDVDEDDNISLRGDQSVVVLVDGRRIAMSASDYLKMFPAEAIDKVEIMTNPSAKYDPEGMSGIINIIMNKEKAKGFNVKPSLTGGIGRYGAVNGNVGVNFRRGKWNIQGNLSAGANKSWFSGEGTRTFPVTDSLGNEFDLSQVNEDDGIFSGENYFGKVGVDHYISDNTTIYVMGTGWIGENVSNRNMLYETLGADGMSVAFWSNRDAEDQSTFNGYEANGGFQHKFKNNSDHTLDFDANLSVNSMDNDGFYDEAFSSLPSLTQLTHNDDDNTVLATKLDYVNSLTLDLEYEAGIHTTSRRAKTGVYSETENLLFGTGYLPDTNLNNEFNFDQDVIAAYFTFGHDIKKFGYKLGLRGEQTFTKSHLVSGDSTVKNDYFSLFPSVHTTYKWSRKQSIQLNYSRRLNRPRLGMLNPFPSYSDPYTIQAGNPFLRPEFIHVFELNYLKYWDKITFNGAVFFRQVNDIMRRGFRTTNGVTLVTTENLASGNLSGAEGIVSFSPYKWWRSRVSFNAWQSDINDPSQEQNLDFNNWGWSIMAINSHPIRDGKWNLQTSARYQSALIVLQGEVSPMWGVDMGINRKFKKDRGSINLRLSDVFRTRRFEFTSKGDLSDGFFTATRFFESRSIYLTLSYTFGNLGKAPDHSQDDLLQDDFNAPDMQ